MDKIKIELELPNDPKILGELANILNELQRLVKEAIPEQGDNKKLYESFLFTSKDGNEILGIAVDASSQNKQNWAARVVDYEYTDKENDKFEIKYDFNDPDIKTKVKEDKLYIYLPKAFKGIIAVNGAMRHYFAINGKVVRIDRSRIPEAVDRWKEYISQSQ